MTTTPLDQHHSSPSSSLSSTSDEETIDVHSPASHPPETAAPCSRCRAPLSSPVRFSSSSSFSESSDLSQSPTSDSYSPATPVKNKVPCSPSSISSPLSSSSSSSSSEVDFYSLVCPLYSTGPSSSSRSSSSSSSRSSPLRSPSPGYTPKRTPSSPFSYASPLLPSLSPSPSIKSEPIPFHSPTPENTANLSSPIHYHDSSSPSNSSSSNFYHSPSLDESTSSSSSPVSYHSPTISPRTPPNTQPPLDCILDTQSRLKHAVSSREAASLSPCRAKIQRVQRKKRITEIKNIEEKTRMYEDSVDGCRLALIRANILKKVEKTVMAEMEEEEKKEVRLKLLGGRWISSKDLEVSKEESESKDTVGEKGIASDENAKNESKGCENEKPEERHIGEVGKGRKRRNTDSPQVTEKRQKSSRALT